MLVVEVKEDVGLGTSVCGSHAVRAVNARTADSGTCPWPFHCFQQLPDKWGVHTGACSSLLRFHLHLVAGNWGSHVPWLITFISSSLLMDWPEFDSSTGGCFFFSFFHWSCYMHSQTLDVCSSWLGLTGFSLGNAYFLIVTLYMITFVISHVQLLLWMDLFL